MNARENPLCPLFWALVLDVTGFENASPVQTRKGGGIKGTGSVLYSVFAHIFTSVDMNESIPLLSI